jgi:hypothetical protein
MQSIIEKVTHVHRKSRSPGVVFLNGVQRLKETLVPRVR